MSRLMLLQEAVGGAEDRLSAIGDTDPALAANSPVAGSFEEVGADFVHSGVEADLRR